MTLARPLLALSSIKPAFPFRQILGLLLTLALAVGMRLAHAQEVAPVVRDPVSRDPVYLYRSPITHAFFAANGASYDTLLNRWHTYLKDSGLPYHQATRAELLAGLKPGVLVLGSAVLLDAKERAAIKAYGEAGNSILLTWGTGARDGRGGWSGYGFIEDLMQAKIEGQVMRGQDEWFLNTFANSPITWTLPAGERIFLGKTAETPLRVSSSQLSGRYLDWPRSPNVSTESGAIAYHEKGRSRRVYLGFSESSWEYDAGQDLQHLLSGALAWLRHRPAIVKANWPQGMLAAQLLEMDTEDGFKNAENFARDLDAINARGTFYCLTSIAVKNRSLVSTLARKHEIAYHGDVHVGFKGKTAQEQEKRFKTMTDAMRDILGDDAAHATGFRAPTESYDKVTFQVMPRFNLLHNTGGPEDSEGRLPYFYREENSSVPLDPQTAVVVLPRTQRDDLNYRAAKLPEDKAQALIQREFDYVLESGALGLLSVHSQNYAPDGLMAKLTPVYLKRVQDNRQNVWVASGDQITAWWRAREGVKLKSQPGDGQRLSFEVAAPGKVKGLSFVLVHGESAQPPKSLAPATPGQPQPQIKRLDAWRSVAVFDELPAGTYEYAVQY